MGKDHCIAGLQFNKTGFGQKRTCVFFVCSEAVESKLEKLETIRTVIPPSHKSECYPAPTMTHVEVEPIKK